MRLGPLGVFRLIEEAGESVLDSSSSATSIPRGVHARPLSLAGEDVNCVLGLFDVSSTLGSPPSLFGWCGRTVGFVDT